LPYLPLARDAGFVHVCAHRGYSVIAPENTLPALEAGAAHGATVAEIDIVLTRDDEIVLMHDEILDRTTNGEGRVADRDLAALRQLDAGAWFAPGFAGTRVPTLAEAIRTARRLGIGLLVEIKERQRPLPLLERLGPLIEAEAALDDLLVISFDHPSLLLAQRHIPGLRTEIITHARHVDPAGLARTAGASSVSIEWDMFHADDARALHAAGIAVRVSVPRPARLELRGRYGIDDETALGRALAEGLIDVLAGDDTGFVRGLVDRHAGSGPIG
jgi:glycerophosphoryl diester phosphodiesterase